MTRFTRSYKIRFEDCDSAGIVFYPNYFLMLNRLIEDWFADALGVPWGIMHHERKLGVPTVNMQVEFKKASRLDEVLEWSLELRKLGTRSLTLGVGVSCMGEERIAIETVLVSVDLVADGVSSREIPPDIRAGMKNYLVDDKPA
ncbi:MAG: thioesterase family protein [Desulfuromonadaceae bacterium]|nr:thioesterase family protein [Desulfuromonadaceae bacterium]